MSLASSLFGAFLIATALILQRWSLMVWDDHHTQTADEHPNSNNKPDFSRRQHSRRTWTNTLIGLIGGLMIASALFPRGTWWLATWTLIGILLGAIVVMAFIDVAATWLHYRRTLSSIAEKSLRQATPSSHPD